MTRLTASQVREDFADTLNRVAYGGERVILCRRRKDVAALVSVQDLELLRQIEDRLDNEAADRAASEGVSPQEVERRMAQGNSVRRIIDAGDIANVVAFLASPKSVAINGDAIAAGGGVGRAIHY